MSTFIVARGLPLRHHRIKYHQIDRPQTWKSIISIFHLPFPFLIHAQHTTMSSFSVFGIILKELRSSSEAGKQVTWFELHVYVQRDTIEANRRNWHVQHAHGALTKELSQHRNIYPPPSYTQFQHSRKRQKLNVKFCLLYSQTLSNCCCSRIRAYENWKIIPFRLRENTTKKHQRVLGVCCTSEATCLLSERVRRSSS